MADVCGCDGYESVKGAPAPIRSGMGKRVFTLRQLPDRLCGFIVTTGTP
jgi:hypothetical protein